MTKPQLYPFLNALLTAWKAAGKALGIDGHLRIVQLVEKLPDTLELKDLKLLIAPILTGTAQEQADFYELFDKIYPIFEKKQVEDTPSVSKRKKWIIYGIIAFFVAIAAYSVWHDIKQKQHVEATTTQPVDTTKTTSGNNNPIIVTDSIPKPKLFAHAPPIETLIPKIRTVYGFKYAYMSGKKWLAVGLAALFIWLIGLGIQRLLKKKETDKQTEAEAKNLEKDPHSSGPFIHQMQVPGVENMEFDSFFGKITQELRHRSETEHLIFDPKRTIKASILRGGLATFRYRQPTLADEYLFLIDINNINDHHAHIFDLLYKTLLRSEVIIERFFYDNDVRLCWNEGHRQGVRLSELSHRFSTSRLVVVGASASLINAQTNTLATWTTIFDAWRLRALLTPRSPNEWNATERVLATKFRLLPANLRGLTALADTFEAADIPDFNRWKTQKDPDNTPIRLSDKLSEAAIMANLEAEFITYPNGKEDNRLLLWLAACAIPPVLHWDVTLFFGNFIKNEAAKLNIGNNNNSNGLTLDNLFKINRLQWFSEGKMPEKARRALLNYLETQQPLLYIRLRDAWQDILNQNMTNAQGKYNNFQQSVAFDELRLQMIVNDIKRNMLTDEQQNNHVNELRGLMRGTANTDFVALEIMENNTNLREKSLEDIKKHLNKCLDSGDIDTTINELLNLVKPDSTLQDRLKELKLAIRK